MAAPFDARHLYLRAELEYKVGDFDQGEIFKERLVEALRMTPSGGTLPLSRSAMMTWALASTREGLINPDTTEKAAESAASSLSTTPLDATLARVCLGLTAAEQGDVAAAGRHYDVLESKRDSMPFSSAASVDRLLGLLTHVIGKFDDASTHFEEALAFSRKAGYRPELAWTCCDYADTLLQRNGPSDPEKAMSLLDESLAISTELGMRPLMERVISRQGGLKA
jgi:tetratricopeptide (TPR) repeat protein